MGHYASEMDSTWSKSMDQSERIERLRTALTKIPLSKFTADDAFELARLFSIVDFTKVSEAKLKKFEKIAKLY
jgi:hypothetical protein